MKIGYVSDLHLEFKVPHFAVNDPQEPGDVLLLAGDISVARLMDYNRTDADARSFHKVLHKLKKNWFDKYQLVLYIPGNHEHYNFMFHQTVPRMKRFFEEETEEFGRWNVKVLDNDYVDYQDVRFIGSTLWADFERGSPISMAACGNGMNDFRIIYRIDPMILNYIERRDLKNAAITPNFILDEHNRSKQYIEEVAKQHDGKVVVFTHHGPTYKSLHPQHVGNGLDGAYCSDLSDLILGNHNIVNWIYGHTHEIKRYMVGDCEVLANQCGYYTEQSFSEFNGIKQFEV